MHSYLEAWNTIFHINMKIYMYVSIDGEGVHICF